MVNAKVTELDGALLIGVFEKVSGLSAEELQRDITGKYESELTSRLSQMFLAGVVCAELKVFSVSDITEK